MDFGTVLPDTLADRSIGEKKPRTSGDEGPSMTEVSGYNSKRQEFEVEYDNDAEQLLADMEFKETDTDAERELKLRVLRIYSKRYFRLLNHFLFCFFNHSYSHSWSRFHSGQAYGVYQKISVY